MHEFMHGWGPASLARGREYEWLASLPAGLTPGGGDNLHIILLLYRIYTEWPDYYAFRDHNNLATQCRYCNLYWPTHTVSLLSEIHPKVRSSNISDKNRFVFSMLKCGLS